MCGTNLLGQLEVVLLIARSRARPISPRDNKIQPKLYRPLRLMMGYSEAWHHCRASTKA